MDNLNISFAPDKSAEDKGRINAVEDYLSLLTERIKFCFNGIDENIAQKSDGEEEKQLIYSTIADEVGQFTNTDRNCEVFNDYKNNVASAYYSHAEGYKTTANAPYSHAEGSNTVASNPSCHAEGTGCVASGQSSHAEGENCRATGSYSHAEGHNTIASGIGSHASGWGTVAGDETFAIGKWNKTSKGLFVVGNGHDSYYGASRSDALVLDSGGNLHISGKLTADGGVGYVLPSATADTLGGVMIGDNINVSDSGTISVNLSAYLKSDEISDWAKAESKPVYTAEEVGAAEKNHTHNMSDITDMPEWTKTENKPAYTASEVGAATAADITAAVNAVEIGGRNLLYDSTGNIKNGWSGNTVVNVGGGISGNSLAISRTGYSGNARYFGISKRHFLTDFNVGTSYTLSAWIKVRSDVGLDASGYVMARFRSADDKKLHALSLTVSSQTEKDKWIYYEKTWTINDSDIAKLECVALALDKNGMIEACNIKLEKGTKATDWSPAPEDTTAEITSLSSKQSSLEQTVNGFKATVESTYATNDSVTQKVSAVEQKADKISWIVKSGTSESSMELTSKALDIIAETKIKGDVIVGGVIKSGNYDVAKGSGMKLTLATGEWDSKYFKVSSTGTITATGGTIGGFTISNNSLYNGLDTINHKEGTNETAGVNISVLGGFSAYNGEYGTEMNNGQIRFYSLGRELGYITPGSTDFSDYSKTGIGIVATNQIGGAGLYGRIDLGYKDKMNGNTYIAAYSVCCDGKKNSNDGFNSTFHIKTRFSSGIDVSDIYFSYENKTICSIGIAGYYGVGGISPDVYKWLPVFNDYVAFKRGILFDSSNTSLIYHGANRLLACSSSKIVVGNSKLALSLIGSSLTSSSTISVSSDARMKNHIADLPSKSENLFDYIDGKSFFYNGSNSTAKNYGFIAQDVLTALQKCGLTTDDFAGFCDIHGDGSQYALAYEQFIPLMWNEIKRLRKALSERS